MQEDLAAQLLSVNQNPYFADKLLAGGDEVEGATGLFGTESTNPIPVNGPRGERIYLTSLRSKTGSQLLFHRLGMMESEITGQLLDVFEVAALDGFYRGFLYFSPYHPRRSVKLPVGLSQVDWPADPMGQMFATLGGFGVMGRVESFPSDLEAALRCDRSLTIEILGEVVELGAVVAKHLAPELLRSPLNGLDPMPMPDGIIPASLAM